MQNRKRVLLVAAWLSGAAYAETPLEDYTLQRLEQIQAETVMLEAKAARARIQRELEESGINTRATDLPLNGREMAISPRIGGLPSVEEIYGSGKQLIARLLLSNGKRVELRPGEKIPSTRFRVKAITDREVRVADGDDKRTLTFY